MLTLFKKLFSKPAAEPPVIRARPKVLVESNAPTPSVEVVHLSLAAIIARLPDDLRATVVRPPPDDAQVTLPLATIFKQLPSGAVKMSFASLHRQAPQGVFGVIPSAEKRLVEVPLAEVFRHVKPESLQRRLDQRPADVPDESFNLFGNAANPYEIVPPPVPEPAVLDLSSEVDAAPEPQDSSGSTSGFRLARDPAPAIPRILAPAPEFSARVAAPAPKPPAVAPPPREPALELPAAPLAAAWPEEIRQAIGHDAMFGLPTEAVATGLARGKVTFTWGQLRAWLTPPLAESPMVDDSSVLVLPLQIVAPAFLAAKRPRTEQRKIALDESIPAIFNGAQAADPPPENAPEPVVELAPERPPTPAFEDASAISFADSPAAPPEPIPAPDFADSSDFVIECAPEPSAEPPPSEAPPSAPASIPAALAPAPASSPAQPPRAAETVGEIFGQPEKLSWSPGEIVAHLVHLPGVSGAIVALQEGLPVAHSLAEGVKGEVIAAFLPQIFARLNQYAGEMRLGEVDDLLFTTHGAHCQIYRLGYVYFAVLGKPGESLPWPELRLITEELTRQTRVA